MNVHGFLRLPGIALVLVAALTGVARADVAELRSGELLEGRFLGGTQTSIRFEVGGETRVVPVGDVLALTFDARPAAQAPSASTTQGEGIAGPGEARAQAQAAPPPAPPVAPTTVPAGTKLLVRTRDVLDSNRHGTGHRFTAVLEANLTLGGAAGGQVVAPRGSTVYGVIESSKRSGRVAGQAELVVRLQSVNIGGDLVPVATSGCQAVTENTAGRSAGKVARGAAIGGLANGRKGAKKGAKIGAGAALLTSGNSIYIPSGTLLEFQLMQDLVPPAR